MPMDEKLYQDMRKEFRDRYFHKIAPKLKQHDFERIKRKKIVILFFVIFIFLAIICLFAGIKMTMQGEKNSGFLLAEIFVILAFCIPWGIKKDFENKIKKKIMPIVCECFGENFQWESDNEISHTDYKIDCTDYKTSNLVSYFNRESLDDIFIGEYKNIPIEIVECSLSYKSGKSKATVFEGVIVRIKMNKNFLGNTVIRPDTLLHSAPHGLVHTELEDISFEKKYDVFTNDEVEARYLITPSFMSRLNGIQKVFCADKVSCAFYDKYIYVALHTNKDLFSLCDLFKPLDEGRQYFTAFEEILSIIKLIDYFKLDLKIGL